MNSSVLIIAVAGLTFLGRGSALTAGTPDRMSQEAKKKLSELVAAIPQNRLGPLTLEEWHNPERLQRILVGLREPASLSKRTDLTSAFPRSGSELGSLARVQQSTPSIHPDSAFVRNSCEIPIRHIYSYDASGKLTLDQEEELGGNGWEARSSESRTYDPAGRLTSDVETVLGVVWWRRTLSYDAEGRVTCDMNEGRNWMTGQLEECYSSIAAYDDAGNNTFNQYEYRNEGEPMTGWRHGQTYNELGLAVADSFARLTCRGWEMQQRSQKTYDSVGRFTSSYIDVLVKGEWTPSLRDTVLYDNGGSPYHELEEVWTDQSWAPFSRSTTTIDNEGNPESDIVERWENEQWVNCYRIFFTNDPLVRRMSTLAQEWTGNDWRNTFYWHEVGGPDGRILSQADSNWSDGQLTGCSTLIGECSGEGHNREFLESWRSESWNGGRLICGVANKNRYDWLQQQLSSEQDEFDSSKSVWLPEMMVTWGYEADGRLVSLKSFGWEDTSWVPSDMGFCLYYDDPGKRLDLCFSEVRFAYRQSVSAVADKDKNVPVDFALMQNYPNPCNPTTTIRYGLPARSHVNLTVFNALGQEVSELVQGEQDAGYHDVKFDAHNLSSGVYFYRLHAGSHTETKKLLVVR